VTTLQNGTSIAGHAQVRGLGVSAATHYRTCSLCEAMCGLAVTVRDGVVADIRGDADDVFSRGHVCPKAVALKDVHEDPDRLRAPMRRTAGGWQEIGWEEALDEAAERLAGVQRAHGRSAVAFYQGNPVVHNYHAVLGGQLLARALRTRSLFSATSVDQLPHMLASLLMLGHQLLLPVPDIDRTGFLLVLGANPVASNGSLMTAPGVERRLLALRARGGRLVVVDPRRTETAAMADQHLPIRPGTDAFLLLALLHAIFAEGLAREGRILGLCDGLADVREAAARVPPETAAARTGIAAETIRALARDFAAAPAAVAYGRVGISTQEFGGLCCWLVNVLNIVTGNLDRAGGAMFPRPAVDLVALAERLGRTGHFDRRRSRVRGLPEFGGELPVSTLAEEIETPGEGQVRGLVTLAGNPVLSAPGGARLSSALERLDFMVSVDIYLNETTRHAHLLLPPVGPLERDHYDLVFHALAVRNTARYSTALFEPPAGARDEWQILFALSRRLGAAKGERGGLLARAGRAGLARLGPRGALGLLLRTGPYGRGLRPFGHGLTLRRLEGEPHGVDLGPLEPCLPRRLATPGRRIALAPPRLLEDVQRLLAAPPARGLRLIGRRDLRSNNSWMHNSERLVKGRERCTLLMSPADARRRGFRDGQHVRVRSRAGEVRVRLETTDSMPDGVVSLPHGWGHGREGTRLSVANAHAGASLNDVTDPLAVDALSGVAVLNGTPVEVEPAETSENGG
jgi:anaerobic selenocysteine-containing dehydrogenase